MVDSLVVICGILFVFGLLFLSMFRRVVKKLELKEFYNLKSVMLSVVFGVICGILWILFYEKFRLAGFNLIMLILNLIFACLIRKKYGILKLDEFAVDMSYKISHDLIISFCAFIFVLLNYSLIKPIVLNPHGVGSFAFFILSGYYMFQFFHLKRYLGGSDESS